MNLHFPTSHVTSNDYLHTPLEFVCILCLWDSFCSVRLTLFVSNFSFSLQTSQNKFSWVLLPQAIKSRSRTVSYRERETEKTHTIVQKPPQNCLTTNEYVVHALLNCRGVIEFQQLHILKQSRQRNTRVTVRNFPLYILEVIASYLLYIVSLNTY